MLQLHYFPGNASLIPHIVLEELGVPFELKYVDRAVAAHKSPEYLALNPNGLIPVLVDTSFGGDGKPLVLYETAAVWAGVGRASVAPAKASAAIRGRFIAGISRFENGGRRGTGEPVRADAES